MLIVVVSIVGIVLENLDVEKLHVNPAAIKAIRMLRVVRGIDPSNDPNISLYMYLQIQACKINHKHLRTVVKTLFFFIYSFEVVKGC